MLTTPDIAHSRCQVAQLTCDAGAALSLTAAILGEGGSNRDNREFLGERGPNRPGEGGSGTRSVGSCAGGVGT
jgi:hypothetical protein